MHMNHGIRVGKWKRSYLTPSLSLEPLSPHTQLSKQDDHTPTSVLHIRDSKENELSPSGKAVLALVLTGATLLIIFLSTFVFLRRKYGPGYTFWSFVTGTRPEPVRRTARDLTTPDIMESLRKDAMSNQKTQKTTGKAAADLYPISKACLEQKSEYSIPIGLDTKSPAIPDPPPKPPRPVPKAQTKKKRSHLDQKSAASTTYSINIDEITKASIPPIPPPPPSPTPSRLSVSTRSSGPLPPSVCQYGQETCSISDRVISLPSPPSPLLRNLAIPPPPKALPPRFIYSMHNSTLQPSLSHRSKPEPPSVLPRSTFAVPAPSNTPAHEAQSGGRSGGDKSQESERARTEHQCTPGVFRQHPGEEVEISEGRRIRSSSLKRLER
ncbi:hypothetical protein AWENTII_010063 [Aspergillus wentii]